LAWAEQKRANNEFTVPSTVAEELTYNPFMRVNEKSIKSAIGFAEDASAFDVMKEVRARKDKF
jgi:hydroxyacylglutathione hydrolase